MKWRDIETERRGEKREKYNEYTWGINKHAQIDNVSTYPVIMDTFFIL